MKPRFQSATVFAPATVANVACGFDLLGFAIDALGDEVTVSRISTPRVELVDLDPTLPANPAENTASVGLLQLIRDLQLDFGFRVSVKKGIPIGSGLGGSAASAVGAVVAANALLAKPLSREKLVHYALLGEYVASGSTHADNVAPCIFGGLTLARSINPIDVLELPVPGPITCALVKPTLQIETRAARQALAPHISLAGHIQQSAALASFLVGCFQNDVSLIQKGVQDVLIEPQRSSLIPGFFEVKKAALGAGALACSISGSGPTVFALCSSGETAEAAATAMARVFSQYQLDSQIWTSAMGTEGAAVVRSS